MAVLHGHVPVVDALLRAGANMHTRTLVSALPTFVRDVYVNLFLGVVNLVLCVTLSSRSLFTLHLAGGSNPSWRSTEACRSKLPDNQQKRRTVESDSRRRATRRAREKFGSSVRVT